MMFNIIDNIEIYTTANNKGLVPRTGQHYNNLSTDLFIRLSLFLAGCKTLPLDAVLSPFHSEKLVRVISS